MKTNITQSRISQIQDVVEITTEKEKEHGVQVWFCPITEMRFKSFNSGYTRIEKRTPDGKYKAPKVKITVPKGYVYSSEAREEFLGAHVLYWRNFILNEKK